MANLRLCTATRHNIYRPETADGESSYASAICEVRKSAYGFEIHSKRRAYGLRVNFFDSFGRAAVVNKILKGAKNSIMIRANEVME